ncbi:MAG: hypothetical protein P4L55_16030, partial [Syntrophobacteraceae bacterium]|nr:hypothetical protein [Syntrophobacteraceae bacterium]
MKLSKLKLAATGLILAAAALFCFLDRGEAQTTYVPPPVLVPGIDYTLPNYGLSPIMRKFVDSLTVPGRPQSHVANNLGNYLPYAVPDTASYPGADYYEFAVVDYTQQMSSDLPGPCTTSSAGVTTCGGTKPGTEFRGYVQIEPPGSSSTPAGSLHIALKNPDGTAVTFNGAQVYGFDYPRYFGPVIGAIHGRPTRIKFYNLLRTTANGGELFLPVDTTIMGAGMGPPTQLQPNGGMYSTNRAVIHLHGGDTPWISDGTPYQWFTPAGETSDPSYARGVSYQTVPDMPVPPNGAVTLYYTDGISGRLMFYHDHVPGATRLDVYAGEAAGYLLYDPTENALSTNFASGLDFPLVIQDKGFVNMGDVSVPAGYNDTLIPGGYNSKYKTFAVDPTWNPAVNPAAASWGQTTGSLWFPHVYMPNQNPNDPSGANPMGRWDYGPWFWPVFPAIGNLPMVSQVPESFVDTPLVNGVAYPYVKLDPTTYRFRILNVCNERYVNLQLYVASPIITAMTVTTPGSGYTSPPVVTITPAAGDTTGLGATANATVDLTTGSPTYGQVTGITMVSVGSGYTATPTVTISAPGGAGTSATATATLYTKLTEVGMVPASHSAPVAFPSWWTANDTTGLTPDILDNRPGGVPDPRTMGASFIHIATEGGLAPHAVELKNTPVGYEQNKRSVTVLNVLEHALYLGPAERAEVMVDLSPFAGKTLILYNDAPAPLPAGDPRNDYYTADPDNTFQGGAPPTQAGFGPNTRTLMQIRVANKTPYAPLNVAALNTALSSAYTSTQAAPIIPQTAYPQTSTGPDVYARISDTSLAANGKPRGIASVTVSYGGTSYQSTPTVQFIGGDGSGATAVAQMAGGAIT